MSTLSMFDARAARLDRCWAERSSGLRKSNSETTMKVWTTTRTTYTVSDFLTWYREGSLMLNPNFQRRNVWKPGAKSYLIDTILRGLPIPIILIRELTTDLKTYKPRRDVVDGQQRLRTLISFIAPSSMHDFDLNRDAFVIRPVHNKEYGGKAFHELPEDIRQSILDYQFSVHKFPSDTDDREIVQIFARMNSTGLRLNAQELRNAEFTGAFKTVSLALAAEQLNRWRTWHIFTPDHIARMDEVEFTSELMILIRHGISPKNPTIIDEPYEELEEVDFPDGTEISKRFRAVFTAIDEHLGHDVSVFFGRRTLFYGLFAAIYDLQYGLVSARPRGLKWTDEYLNPAKAKAIPPTAIQWIKSAGTRIATKRAPKAVLDAITRRTVHIKERRTLASYLLGG
jgi:hypothetical protein